MNLAIQLARLLVASVFLYAGILKLGLSERLAITVAQFTFLPLAAIGFFATALPWIEILTGILLLVPRTARIAAFVAAGWLMIFAAALAWAWSQGLAIDCGCFGGEDEPITGGDPIPFALARDIALLAITLLLAARQMRCSSRNVQKIPANAVSK